MPILYKSVTVLLFHGLATPCECSSSATGYEVGPYDGTAYGGNWFCCC